MGRDYINIFIKLSGLVMEDMPLQKKLSGYFSSYLTKFQEHELNFIIGGGGKVDSLRDRFANEPEKLHEAWRGKGKNRADVNTIAHWSAIEIMQENADILQDVFPKDARIRFPKVLNIMKEKLNALPVSWDVTSDSITYWIANNSGMKNKVPWIFLLKPVDGVLSTTPGTGIITRRSSCVEGNLVRELNVKEGVPNPTLKTFPFDVYIFTLVQKYKIPFYIVNFNNPDRIEQIINDTSTSSSIFTKISSLD